MIRLYLRSRYRTGETPQRMVPGLSTITPYLCGRLQCFGQDEAECGRLSATLDDTIALSPALIVTEAKIDRIVKAIGEVLSQIV
jgi:hypothetical protein